MDSAWKNRLAQLNAAGLNAWGVADGRAWSDVLPGCRSVLVFASGGTALWDALGADLKTHPSHLSEEDHPLDAFITRTLNRVDPEPGESRRWIRCSADEPNPVDFRPLAQDAGLGWRSMLGLLIHPHFGPWLGLRAACFTTELLPVSGPLSGEGPCPDCTAPCISACPGDALKRPSGPLGELGGWDVGVCSRFHQLSTLCDTQCHSRRACPEGLEHRYSESQQRYHYNRKVGRRELAEALDISDERVGVGPFWGSWSEED